MHFLLFFSVTFDLLYEMWYKSRFYFSQRQYFNDSIRLLDTKGIFNWMSYKRCNNVSSNGPLDSIVIFSSHREIQIQL